MLTYTVYNQSGGQAKTTVARDLAVAHTELGQRVLIFDLDPQNGSIANYYGIQYDKTDGKADSIAHHLATRGQGKGDFEDLIFEAEPGIDVVPSHKKLTSLEDMVTSFERYQKEMGEIDEDEDVNGEEHLLDIFAKNKLHEEYDVIIADPNAKSDLAYYTALYATRNIVIPAQPTRTGFESIEGVKDSVYNFSKGKNINIGHIATVPVMVDMRKASHKEYALQLRNEFNNTPVYFKSLSAFENAEDECQSVFAYLNDRERISSSQQDIIPKYRTLAAHIQATANEPIPADTWETGEYFTGDDFWGDVEVPFEPESEENETETVAPGVN